MAIVVKSIFCRTELPSRPLSFGSYYQNENNVSFNFYLPPGLLRRRTHCHQTLQIGEGGIGHPSQTVETTYTYNDDDQIVGQVRTRDGVLDFSYVISYRPDGLVDKVDQGEFTLEHSYTSEGKIQKEAVIDDATSQVTQTINYEWGTNSVEITWQRISRSDPYQTTTHDFSGENIVNTVHKSYNDFDNGKLTSIIEVNYSGFDKD